MLKESCTSRDDLAKCFKELQALMDLNGSVTVVGSAKDLQAEEFEMKKKRTITQNSAMHKYFELLAIAFSDAGLDMKAILKDDAEIPATKENIKLCVWKKVQAAMFGEESTTELTTAQVSEVYAVVDRHTSSAFGVHVEFPSWMGSR